MLKHLLIAGMFLCSASAVTAQTPSPTTEPTSKASIQFEKDVHDFGTLQQGGDATTSFKFTNTGIEPLIISNAKGSCGCTVPQWPREPIQPGQSGEINVKYDSKRLGQINKSVTITSNASNEPTKVIRIKGNILGPETPASGVPTKEQGSVPAN